MSDKCVHTEHCCLRHGCKYGDPDCPVENGEKVQSYECEECHWDPEPTLDELKKSLVKFNMVAVPDNVEGKLWQAKNCIERGNDGDGLNRVCQALDLINSKQEPTE